MQRSNNHCIYNQNLYLQVAAEAKAAHAAAAQVAQADEDLGEGGHVEEENPSGGNDEHQEEGHDLPVSLSCCLS